MYISLVASENQCVDMVECDTVGHILDAALTTFGFSNPNVIRGIYRTYGREREFDIRTKEC